MTDQPIEARAVPDDAVLDILGAWARKERWFPAKGTDDALVRLAVLDLPDPLGEADVTIHLLALASGTTLQVPVCMRRGVSDPQGTIGHVPNATVIDGCHDPAFIRAWVAAATHATPVSCDVTDMQIASGEQSNTSVLLPSAQPPAILKVLRGVVAGPNPEVEVPYALRRAGWSGVPRPLAWLTAAWPEATGERVTGHLGVLSELVVGAEDGFSIACNHAQRDEDFSALAGELGRTTAQMHRALRTAFPIGHMQQRPRTAGIRAAELHHVTQTLRRRALTAIEQAPVLASRTDAIENVFTMVDPLESIPPLQRVHGDYHLGQILRSPDPRWYVLDFEGEPRSSAAEKTRPDLALRDVAGMLRSFDYAASVGNASSTEWARSARTTFVDGYNAENKQGTPDPCFDVLLRALELDKALYEVVYESRNRPTWVKIPLEGVDRLLATDT